MSLSVAVMAHHKRDTMVDDLLDRLDRPAKVVWDQVNDRHDTGARAMEAFDPSCTHHLVIQDDALPCRDLIGGIERAINWVPQDVALSFYTGKVRPFGKKISEAVRVSGGCSWIVMKGIYWGPAVALPTASIPAMLDWYRSPAGGKVTNYDRRMSTWWENHKIAVWYSRPSLVDHRGDESLCHHTKGGRHAHGFLGETESALEVDWSMPPFELVNSAALDRARQANVRRRR